MRCERLWRALTGLVLLRCFVLLAGCGFVGGLGGHGEGQRQGGAEESADDRFHGFLAGCKPLQERAGEIAS